MELVLPIACLRRTDVAMVGGKAANLGEVINAAIPIPPGFVVTVAAYEEFLADTGVGAYLDLEKADEPRATTNGIRDLIANAELPQVIASAVADAYHAMGQGPVAVRSSATAEDLAEASFAGQQDTYLNVRGEPQVLRSIQDCWASLYGSHAVHYRAAAGFGQAAVKIAVVVQQMVEADRSGVMFTLNPVTNDNSQVLIEAVYGLGESCVSGVVTPDMYIVAKNAGIVLDRQIQPQARQLARRSGGSSGEGFNEWVDVDGARRSVQKLADEEIGRLVEMGVRLEQHFGCPQDIEWAIEGEDIYVVQARPVTGLR
jgi:pyruvate,water dikinase